VIALVRKQVHDGPSRALLGSVHQLTELLLLVHPGLALSAEALAGRVLVFGRIRKNRIGLPPGTSSRQSRWQRQGEQRTQHLFRLATSRRVNPIGRVAFVLLQKTKD
jgi:hypothetical protein